MGKQSLHEKLRLQTAEQVLIINAPESFIEQIEPLIYDTSSTEAHVGKYNAVLLFANKYEQLVSLCAAYASAGTKDCIFWIGYPKGTGTLKCDIKRERAWDALASIGLEAITGISIDDNWTAIRGKPISKSKN